METKKVIILRGSPGSGKSTYIRNHLPGAVVCSADDFFIKNVGGKQTYVFNPTQLGAAHNQCFNCFKQAIGDNEPLIVIDNTNIFRQHYQKYVDYARMNGYDVYQKVLKTSFKNVHNVPDTAVERMKKNLEVDPDLPEYDETIKS